MSMSASFVNAEQEIGPISQTTQRVVQISNPPSGTIQLSPFDFVSGGRALPELWFFEDDLDDNALLSSLEQALAAFPVLCGRYSHETVDGYPAAVELTNTGVPVYISSTEISLADAIAHLPRDGADSNIFQRSAHEPWVPPKEGMDHDPMTPDVPLFALRITHFAQGGVAIGVLTQHIVMDGLSVVNFMTNWSQIFRGVPLHPEPSHDRCTIIDGLGGAGMPRGFEHYTTVPAAHPKPPAFAGVMPQISGAEVCIVPFAQELLVQMKQDASVDMPEGLFVSTDDVLSAVVWRALTTMRCGQVRVEPDSTTPTKLARACQVRDKASLGAGYCGNAVVTVFTELPVCELLQMSVQEIALKLRSDLSAVDSGFVGAGASWIRGHHQAGDKVVPDIDKDALTFVVSSWMFDWQGVIFNARPVAFDHGALVPIVATFSTRHGGGVDVYTSGPRESLEVLTKLLK